MKRIASLEVDQPLGDGCWACHWKATKFNFLIHKKRWHLPRQSHKMTGRFKGGNMSEGFWECKMLHNVWGFLFSFIFQGNDKEEEKVENEQGW